MHQDDLHYSNWNGVYRSGIRGIGMLRGEEKSRAMKRVMGKKRMNLRKRVDGGGRWMVELLEQSWKELMGE